ncbi:hypothetical protein [Leptospira noguchii]
MIRNFLKGKEGDLSAAGFNFSKLIRAFFCYFENLIYSSFLFSI